MLSKEKLNRINELAKKSKSEGLTSQEKKEQQQLREQYLQNIRKSFKGTIENMKVIDPNGEDVTPEKVNNLKKYH